MIDTIRIGHMIGPPFWKLSIRKFVQPVLGGGAAGAAGLAAGEAAPVKVAETTGLGIAPGAPGEVAGALGAPSAGDGIAPGAAGDATAPGTPGVVATPGGGGSAGVVVAAGGGGGGG